MVVVVRSAALWKSALVADGWAKCNAPRGDVKAARVFMLDSEGREVI